MNIDSAKSFALDYLMNFVGPGFQFHNLSRTLDVFQSVSILAINENTNQKDLTLLQTAALYHNLGIHKSYFTPETESVKIIQETLPGFDFKPSEIKFISKLISETNSAYPPNSKLGELLCDAVTDYLGRDDYMEISGYLRKEMEDCGIKRSFDQEWFLNQLDYLEKHRYYTPSAINTRQEGKLNNIDRISEILINL
jgi:exopolyphosphatase/pppGpp-phosphohydrolase